MLLEILSLIREANGRPLSRGEIAARLDIPPEVVEHMLQTLLRRGRLKVDPTCSGCDHCPLHKFCAGAPFAPQAGYVLAEQQTGWRAKI